MNISFNSLFYSSISNDYGSVPWWKPRRGITSLHCALLCCTLQILFFFKLKVYGNLVSSKAINAIFPTAFAHFVSLSNFGNSCSISNFFIIMIFLMVMFDVTLVTVLECHRLLPYRTVHIMDKWACSNWSTDCPFPHFSPYPLASLFPEIQQLKLCQSITLQWPLSVQVKGRVSLILNQN